MLRNRKYSDLKYRCSIAVYLSHFRPFCYPPLSPLPPSSRKTLIQIVVCNLTETLITRLHELGFKEVDCISALHATSGRLEASATWLLENATPILQEQQEAGSQLANNSSWHFAGFEVVFYVSVGFVCFRVICASRYGLFYKTDNLKVHLVLQVL